MLIQADAFHLPYANNIFHAIVTSPPYWGLRKYDGEQGEEPLGLEATPERHIERMVESFREVWRVLRPDGVVWLDYGDCFSSKPAGNPGVHGLDDKPRPSADHSERMDTSKAMTQGNLMLMPHRLAIALQADGWIVRNDLVWFKRNPMPESISGWHWYRHRLKDENDKWYDCSGCDKCLHDNPLFPPLHILRKSSWRHTRAHEYVFMLTKQMKYYCNQEAVREAASQSSLDRISQKSFESQTGGPKDWGITGINRTKSVRQILEHFATNPSRNPRSVLDVPTSPYSMGTEIYRLRRVAKDVASDGMIHIALPYCREHGSLAVRLAKEFCGEHEDDLLIRIERIYSHLFQERLGGFFPTHRHDGHCSEPCNSDWIPPEYSLSAIDHNNSSHKMALSLENAIPYMPFFEMVGYTADKRGLLSYFVQHLCIYGSRIMSGDFLASLSRRIPHRILDKQQAEALKASDCSCSIYERYTKKADHYATFPPNLIAPLIRASVPRRCCPVCGQAWAAVVKRRDVVHKREPAHQPGNTPTKVDSTGWKPTIGNVTGYRPTCDCGREDHIPGIVLDIFAGSGTVPMVANELGLRSVGMDISYPYLDEQARYRAKWGEQKTKIDDLPLFGGQPRPKTRKQDELGKRTYTGFNERWNNKQGKQQIDEEGY